MAETIPRLALIGIGLIGSSIARGVRQWGLADEIVVQSRRAETVATAERLGLGDRYTTRAAEAAEGADLVIMSIPVGACGAVAEEIAPALKPGAIVSDVGSVKASVIRQVEPWLPHQVHFVPAHPVAGTEHSGPGAGFAELFIGRWCILTPHSEVDRTAVARVRALWEALGAHVEEMPADHHDMVLAITSHVPHLIAYNIVGTAAHLEQVTQSEVMKFAAGGFRDFTRIASSDPTMWRDVFLNNREAVLEMLGRFSEDLTALQRAIRWGEGDMLFDLFTRTRAIRRGIIEAGQETDAPDFGRPHTVEPPS
jgi:cyclohexadieny/prephenate dehydrogenase